MTILKGSLSNYTALKALVMGLEFSLMLQLDCALFRPTQRLLYKCTTHMLTFSSVRQENLHFILQRTSALSCLFLLF